MNFIRFALLLVASIAAACAPPADRVVETADLLLRGGQVLSMDTSIGRTQAVAVKGHTILAVGSDTEVERYLGSETQVIELEGRTVIPGLIEGHGHFLGLGRAQQVLDLTAAPDYDAILKQVAQAVDRAEPGAWILGMGWHQDKWSSVPAEQVEGVPVNDSLSALSPENPVLLSHASGHAAFANDIALAAAAIAADTEDPPGGTIVRDERGVATGLLRETAQRLMDAPLAQSDAQLTATQRTAIVRERVRLAGDVALSFGVTSFHDAGASFGTIDTFKAFEAEGQLPVRLYVMIRGEALDVLASKLPDYYLPAEGNDFLAVRSIKRQIDGALGAHGAWLLQPYEDLPDSRGLVLEPVADIAATARLAIEHGFQVNTHAIGTRANREVLDLYEREWRLAEVAGKKLRWRIEHAQHIHPADVPRFGQMGVIASIQGVHCTSDGPWLPKRLGAARTQSTSYRWRDLLDSGARINNGTDVPVESIDPFVSIQASVTRLMSDGTAFHPAQAITRLEALKSYTLDNAYAAFEEHIKGSITPGKLADLVVLNGDYLTIEADQLSTLRAEVTILGGRVVYLARSP